MSQRNSLLVVGTATIGEPLIGLCCHFKQRLGIDEVLFYKKTPLLIDRSKVVDLINRGARLAADSDQIAAFEEIDLKVSLTREEALAAARVVIDCTPAASEHKEQWYRPFADNTHLFVAQGNIVEFGEPYARGINDSILPDLADKYLQVVSCNTHNIAELIGTLGLTTEGDNNLRVGRFVCLRRANDISQDERYVPSPTPYPHDDKRFGTHHARDAWRLFNTLGHDLSLFSSAVKLNSQFMHLVHFHLEIDAPLSREQIVSRLETNDRIAMTYKTSSNTIFSFGRDHGFFGRILNQCVVPYHGLHLSADGREITGTSFTPQDGNSLLSSVAATVWALYPETYEKIIQCLRPYFFQEV